MAAFLFIMGGIASAPDSSGPAKNMMVSSLILFGAAYCLSWAPVSYVILGEASSSRVKEKTNLLAVCISVLTTFVTSFTLPYLLNAPYAALGGKVGYIYGSFCWAMVVAAYFLIPELKGRSLEEVDQLFASGVALRKFGRVETIPVEARDVMRDKIDHGGRKEKVNEESVEDIGITE